MLIELRRNLGFQTDPLPKILAVGFAQGRLSRKEREKWSTRQQFMPTSDKVCNFGLTGWRTQSRPFQQRL
jgi:hypothetical protein